MPLENLLPNLGSSNQLPEEPDWMKVLKQRKIKGRLSDLMYEINANNVQAQTQFGDAVIKAMLGYQGNANLNVSRPLLGGTLGFNANRDNGNNNYRLQYQRNF